MATAKGHPEPPKVDLVFPGTLRGTRAHLHPDFRLLVESTADDLCLLLHTKCVLSLLQQS